MNKSLKKKKTWLAGALVSALLGCFIGAGSFAVYAEETAGPGMQVELTAQEAAHLAKLRDGQLNWDEVDELVSLQAPAWLELSEGYRNQKTEYTGACELYQTRRQEDLDAIDEELEKIRETKKQLSELKPFSIVDEKGTTREQAIRQQEEAARMLRIVRQDVRKSIGAYVIPVGDMLNKQAKELEKQRIAIVDGIHETMTSYRELEIQRDLMVSYVALTEANNSAMETSFKLGLVSEDDLKASRLGLEQAKLSMNSTELSLTKLRNSLGRSLGLKDGTLQKISGFPEPDTAFFTSIDRDADLKKLFEGNGELKDAKKNFGKYGTRQLQDAAVNQIKSSLRSEYETKYATLRDAKNQFEDALQSEAEAAKQLGIAKEKFSRGLISALEMRSEENTYAEAKAAAELASLSYRQAIDQYRTMLIVDEDTV